MTFALGTKSLAALEGVHPNLVKIVKRAIQLSPVDFRVGEGVRTASRQAELYAQGRTKPGKIVTWVKVSNHQAKPDGYGHAVDLWVLNADGTPNWNDVGKYDAVADAMFAAALEFGLKIRTGSDWDMDGKRHEHGETDMAHFELLA
jgi:peptidoglycan LD-endopeptidase CwlK